MNMYFRGIVCRFGEKAYTDDIKNDIEDIELTIYGPPKIYKFPDGVVAICNKDEERNFSAANRAVYDDTGVLQNVIAGDFILAFTQPGIDGYLDMPEILENNYMERFELPDYFKIKKDGTVDIIPYDPTNLDMMLEIFSEDLEKRRNRDMPRIEEVPEIEECDIIQFPLSKDRERER